ncbi:MAG: hypothetical protein JXA94_03320 [Parachlamydiales bacterium]|nr:hypothetical protein [Parachlamydiales bacterium]
MAAAAGRKTSAQYLHSEAGQTTHLPGLVEDFEERSASPEPDPRIQKILAMIEAGNEAIKELQAENDILSFQVKDLTHEIEKKNAEIKLLSEELGRAGEKSGKATYDLERVKAQLIAANEANKTLASESLLRKDYLASSEATSKRHADEMAEMKISSDTLQERIRQLQSSDEYSTKQYTELDKECERLREDLGKLKIENRTLTVANKAFESSDKKLQQIILELQEKNKALAAENERLQQELKKCRFGTCCVIV